MIIVVIVCINIQVEYSAVRYIPIIIGVIHGGGNEG